MNYENILKYLSENYDFKTTKDTSQIIKYLYNDLKDKTKKELLDFIFFDMFNYENNQEETIQDKIQRKDWYFKKDVKNYYKKCIITGRSEYICEVAHIYPFSDSSLDDKYNPYNGILICRDLHKLFDNKLLKINPDNFQLLLDDIILLDNNLEIYHKYHNKILDIRPQSKQYFTKLYRADT